MYKLFNIFNIDVKLDMCVCVCVCVCVFVKYNLLSRTSPFLQIICTFDASGYSYFRKYWRYIQFVDRIDNSENSRSFHVR